MTAAKNMSMWHRGFERGAEARRKHSITPGDARTFAILTYGASARLVDLYSSNVCDFALLLLFSFVFLLRLIIGESGMGPAPVLYLGSKPLAMLSCVPHYLI